MYIQVPPKPPPIGDARKGGLKHIWGTPSPHFAKFATDASTHNELQWGKLPWTHLWIDHSLFFFCKEVENLVKVLLLCHGGRSPEAEAHVAQ